MYHTTKVKPEGHLGRLGTILNAYRQKYDINQQTMAQEMGIPWQTYVRLEHGKGCTGGTVAKILFWMLEAKE